MDIRPDTDTKQNFIDIGVSFLSQIKEKVCIRTYIQTFRNENVQFLINLYIVDIRKRVMCIFSAMSMILVISLNRHFGHFPVHF